MGMFDSIRNYFDIGPGFNRRMLQTKDIDEYPSMRNFWLDPAGQLWEIDCNGTHDFYEDESIEHPLVKWKWVPNGRRGKCKPFIYNGSIRVYPEKWEAKYAAFPECKLLFRDGILEVITHIDKSNLR